MERCPHGLKPAFCSFCTPSQSLKPSRTPHRSTETTEFGQEAVDTNGLLAAGIHIVRPHKGRDDASFNTLDETVTFIHFDGQPNLWAVEKILARTPNLKTVQVIPSARRFIDPGTTAHRLLQERGVTVQTGHVRPDLVWEPDRIISKTYEPQRQFLLRLEDEQKALFEELLAMKFEAALMAARYYCLAGEDYLPQRAFCAIFGFSPRTNHSVSAWINAVLYYLDPGFPVSSRSKQRAAEMKRKVERLRPLMQDAERRQQLAADLGLAALPADLPLARLDVFREFMAAKRTGGLDRLASEASNDWRALTLRFGLAPELPSTYRTLEEVGGLMGGITRERVRQLEERGLAALGISAD